MKIKTATNIHIQKINLPTKQENKVVTTIATGTGIDIRSLNRPPSIIKENNASDPLVSKKILDSLSLGIINFNQKERDTIAKILGDRAKKVIEARGN